MLTLYRLHVTGLVWAAALLQTLYSPVAAADDERMCAVTTVTDGDTLRVNCSGVSSLVRLIGIDAPEISINERVQDQARRFKEDPKAIVDLGIRSKNYARSLLRKSSVVFLKFDEQRYDRYGRLLAYVFTEQGTFINTEILRNGYAALMTHFPGISRVQELRLAYEEGKTAKRGLWNYKGFPAFATWQEKPPQPKRKPLPPIRF